MTIKKRTPLAITRSVVFALVLREMQTRFGARRMGAFWMVFEPIAHISFLLAIMTVIRGRHLPGIDIVVFLITGLVPFFMMRNIVMKLKESIGANKALFAYPNIKPFDTLIARAIVESVLYACIYVCMVSALAIWFNHDMVIHKPLEWFASISIGILFSFALGTIFCVVVQEMPNAKSTLSLVFMPLYFISGVIFPVWVIPAPYLEWLLWNPYLHIIDNLRAATFEYYPVTKGVSFTYPLIATLIMLFFALGLYRIRRQELLAL